MKTIVFSLITLTNGTTYNLPANLNNVNIANYKLANKELHGIQIYTVTPAHAIAIQAGLDTVTVINATNDTTYLFRIKVK